MTAGFKQSPTTAHCWKVSKAGGHRPPLHSDRQTESCHPMTDGVPFNTSIPQRLDRMRWSRWHLRMVIALGITWLLDGLEVTLAGSLASLLKEPTAMGFS